MNNLRIKLEIIPYTSKLEFIDTFSHEPSPRPLVKLCVWLRFRLGLNIWLNMLDIVLNIHGNFFKVLADQNLEWFLVPVLRDTSLTGVAQVLNPVTEAVMLGYYLTQLSGLRLEIRHILFKLDNPQ